MGILSSTTTDPSNLPGTDMLGNREALGWTANTAYTGSQTIGNTVIDPRNPTTVGDRVPVTAAVTISAAADTAGAILAWANPTGGTILITQCAINVTTFSSGACTVDVGVAANGTTSSDTLIDGASVATPARCIDNIKDAGTNGTSVQPCTSGQYVTASTATGNIAGAAGTAYITYIRA